jgi:hypothetical protein
MRRVAFAGWVSILWLQPLLAQSVVFVSPSTEGQRTLTCSVDSLHSFEELHYLAIAHYLTDKLCPNAQIDGALGLWGGRAENSSRIDGCSHDRARVLGALLGKYFHQKAALVFDRGDGGNATLVSFRVTRPIGVISAAMTRARISGATVIPRAHDSLIVMVATDTAQRARAHRLSAALQGQDLREVAGTSELIGDRDRVKARDIYNALLANAPADVQQLDRAMYSEEFSDLGLESGK